MPTLDVTRVLFNPRFCDRSLTYTRRSAGVDDDGFPAPADGVTKPFAGVVTVDRSVEAQMRMSGQVVNGCILVVTITPLTAGDKEHLGDVVKYQGRDYLVKSVDPYTAYGRGFVRAHCELIPFDGGVS